MIEKQKKIFTLVIEEDRGSNMVDIKGIANLLKVFVRIIVQGTFILQRHLMRGVKQVFRAGMPCSF